MPAKKQVTREQILAAALALLRRGGAEAVNVTALARALGCSTQPIYLSFSGMDALRRALVGEAADFFVRALTRAEDGRPHLYGMAYIRFAQEEKELFRFLFLRPGAYPEIRDALKPMMESAMAELMETYHIDHQQADYLHDQLWMHDHGIASMIATEFCDWDLEKAAMLSAECHEALGRLYAEKRE